MFEARRSAGGRRLRAALVAGAAVLGVLTIAPGAMAQTYEPNDSFNTGFGPVTAGTTYSAATETDNDADYYYFYVPQRTQMFFTLSATKTVNDSLVCSEIHQQTNAGYSEIDDSYLDPRQGQTQTASVTLDAGKYFFLVNDYCSEATETYTFRITPAGSTSTYEPFAAQCAAAHPPVVAASEERATAERKLQKTRDKLAEARARNAPRPKIQALKAKVKSRKASLKAAKAEFEAAVAAENAACSVPM